LRCGTWGCCYLNERRAQWFRLKEANAESLKSSNENAVWNASNDTEKWQGKAEKRDEDTITAGGRSDRSMDQIISILLIKLTAQ